jgi:AcrR family transcriptional regulator
MNREYSAHVAKRSRTPLDETTRKKKTRGIGRPTNKGSIGKEVLIEKTAQLLRTLPPEKLSLTAAAQAANVHLTLLKYYFQDRTRLLIEVARHLTFKFKAKVEAAEDDRPPPPERLRIRIDAMVDFYFEHPFYHRLMVEIIAETEDPLATELINVWMSRTLEIYRGIMTAGVEQGSLRALDVSFTYLAIMGLCEQFHYSLRLFADRTTEPATAAPSDRSAAAARRYKAFLYDFVFNGLGARPTDSRMGAPIVAPEDK